MFMEQLVLESAFGSKVLRTVNDPEHGFVHGDGLCSCCCDHQSAGSRLLHVTSDHFHMFTKGVYETCCMKTCTYFLPCSSRRILSGLISLQRRYGKIFTITYITLHKKSC